MSIPLRHDPHKWIGKFKDIPVFLMGNAPSLKNRDLSPFKDYFTIGINRIFYIFEPTILIWQDLDLWNSEKDKIRKNNSVKYIRDGSGGYGGEFKFRLNCRENHNIINTLREMKGRGSTGVLAYQLAFAMGCNPIFLLGMDCQYAENGDTDFYGKNTRHRASTLKNCEKGLTFILNNLHGKTVYSCSKDRIFPDNMKIPIEKALEMMSDKKISKETILKILYE